jgi:anti-sigma B factor antagonist
MKVSRLVNIHHHIEEGVTFLGIEGEVDAATQAQLRAAADEALTDFTATLRIDLSQVSFIDSTGISALLRIRERAQADRHTLIIDNPSARVRAVLELTGLAGTFQIS